MLCSLCFTNALQYIEIPCGHHICIECAPKPTSMPSSYVQYQCETCLSIHQIHLQSKKGIHKQNRLHTQNIINSERSSCNSQNLYCWSCFESIPVNQYIKGKHNGHRVDTYNDASPSLKNKLIQQLQKGLTLTQYLNQKKNYLENTDLRVRYQAIFDKVQIFFANQHEILDKKQEKIMEQLQGGYKKCMQIVQNQINVINPSLKDLTQLCSKISQFLSDVIPITQLQQYGNIPNLLQSCLKNIKRVNFELPQLPTFVQKHSIKQSIQSSCVIFINKNERILKIQTEKQNIFQKSRFSDKQQHSLDDNRKVKIVQKLKWKIRNSSSNFSVFA